MKDKEWREIEGEGGKAITDLKRLLETLTQRWSETDSKVEMLKLMPGQHDLKIEELLRRVEALEKTPEGLDLEERVELQHLYKRVEALEKAAHTHSKDVIDGHGNVIGSMKSIKPTLPESELADLRKRIEAAIEAASYNGEIGCKRDWIYKTEAFAAIAAACVETRDD